MTALISREFCGRGGRPVQRGLVIGGPAFGRPDFRAFAGALHQHGALERRVRPSNTEGSGCARRRRARLRWLPRKICAEGALALLVGRAKACKSFSSRRFHCDGRTDKGSPRGRWLKRGTPLFWTSASRNLGGTPIRFWDRVNIRSVDEQDHGFPLSTLYLSILPLLPTVTPI